MPRGTKLVYEREIKKSERWNQDIEDPEIGRFHLIRNRRSPPIPDALYLTCTFRDRAVPVEIEENGRTTQDLTVLFR